MKVDILCSNVTTLQFCKIQKKPYCYHHLLLIWLCSRGRSQQQFFKEFLLIFYTRKLSAEAGDLYYDTEQVLHVIFQHLSLDGIDFNR